MKKKKDREAVCEGLRKKLRFLRVFYPRSEAAAPAVRAMLWLNASTFFFTTAIILLILYAILPERSCIDQRAKTL
jgi:hypothetical protein